MLSAIDRRRPCPRLRPVLALLLATALWPAAPACRSSRPSGDGGGPPAAPSGEPDGGGGSGSLASTGPPPAGSGADDSESSLPQPPLDAESIARLADDLVNLYGPTVSMAMMSLGRAGSAAVPELVKRLESADANMRYRALIVLGRIGDRSAEGAIRALLDDPSDNVRVSARIALLRFGAREELPALLELAMAPEPPALRAAALSGLATLRVEEALAAFRCGIRAPQPDVRYWSVQGLRALDDKASAGELVTLLCDPSAEVAGAAADAVRALHAPSTHADVAKAYSASSGAQRALILELLEDLGHPEIAAFVRQAVADESPEVRATAVRLASRAAPDAGTRLDWLESGSRDAAPTVRSLALRGLGLAGGDRARAILKRALFDEDPFARFAAADGLGRAGTEAEIADLAKLETAEPVAVVRGAATAARARLGDWSAVEALVASLDDSLLADAARAALADLFGEDLGPSSSAWKAKFLDKGKDAFRYDAGRRRFAAATS